MALVSPAATGTGWIRLGHLSPDTPPVDVCVYSCGNSSARIGLPEVEYGDISPYETLSAGNYSIAIRPAEASASGQPVMSASVAVMAGHAYTVACDTRSHAVEWCSSKGGSADARKGNG